MVMHERIAQLMHLGECSVTTGVITKMHVEVKIHTAGINFLQPSPQVVLLRSDKGVQECDATPIAIGLIRAGKPVP